MLRKYKLKVFKYNKNLFYVVIALNKKSIKSHYVEKIGVCFFKKNVKIIMLSLKKLAYWLNKGVNLTNYISFLATNIFLYYLKQNNKKLIIYKNTNKCYIY